MGYTELEYDFAVSSGMPYFAVVIDEDTLKSRVKAIGSSVLEKDNPDKLKAFREKVLSKMSSFFSDYKDVKLAVLETVPQLESEYKVEGWVRATEIPDTKALADELARLHAENQKLRDSLTTQAKQIEKRSRGSSASEEEFAELFDLFSSMNIDMTTAKQSFKNASRIPDKVSMLRLALSLKDMLMTGITNQIGMTDLQSFVFFTLCPKLQIHELVQNEKVAGARYRRYAITKKGTQFFAYVEKMLHEQKKRTTGSAASKKKATKKRKAANKSS